MNARCDWMRVHIYKAPLCARRRNGGVKAREYGLLMSGALLSGRVRCRRPAHFSTLFLFLLRFPRAMAARSAELFSELLAASSIADPKQLLAAIEAAHAAVSSEDAASDGVRPQHVRLVSSDMLLNAAATDDVTVARCARCAPKLAR